MTALVVEFVDELPPGRTITPTGDIAAFAKQLRRRQNEWAVYPWTGQLGHRTLINRASDINHGRYSAPLALREGFEAAVRDGVMYVRYIGAKK